LPELAWDLGLDDASPVSPEDEDAPVLVLLDPDVAQLSDEESAVASPPSAAASAAASDEPVEVAAPVSPPIPVEPDVEEPEEPELAEPDDDEPTGPEPPPVALPVTSPESPDVTSTAMPPVPPPEPPPVPPLLAPAPPVLPDDPLALAPPPSPLDAVPPPFAVASPVSPLDDEDVVVVFDDPELEPDPDEELDDALPLVSSGSSSVRTTLAEVCGVSSGSMEAMSAAKAIFSNMTRSVLSVVTSGDGGDRQLLRAPVSRSRDGGDRQVLLAPVLGDVSWDEQGPPPSAGHDHRGQGQQGERRDSGIEEQNDEAHAGS
jgi:hypothetical protein